MDEIACDIDHQASVGISQRHSKVILCLSRAISMDISYKDGLVQALIDKMVPIALQFGNEQLDVYVYSERAVKVVIPVKLRNQLNYVQHCIVNKGFKMGHTSYSAMLNLLLKEVKEPTFVVFVTDDDSEDNELENKALLREISDSSIFIQFVGLKHANSKHAAFLRGVKEMDKHITDSNSFFEIRDTSLVMMEADAFQTKLLNKYLQSIKSLNCI